MPGRRAWGWCAPLLLAVGCGAIIDDLEDVTWVPDPTGGVGGQGDTEQGAGAAGGAGGAGGGGPGAGATGGGCAAPDWSGKASQAGATQGACNNDGGDAPAPTPTFPGCPHCEVTPTTLDTGFSDGWAPYCAFLRTDDARGDIVIDGGEAILRTSCSSWGGQDYGPFLFRAVEIPQFVVAARVHATNGHGNPVSHWGHGAGLLVRNTEIAPTDLAEDRYLRLSAGYDNTPGDAGPAVFSWRKHQGGDPAPTATLLASERIADGGGAVDLAFCRSDLAFEAWFRDGAGWARLSSVELLDDWNWLGVGVQVGVEAHAYQGGSMVEAKFADLRFAPLEESQGCQGAVEALGAQLAVPQK